VSASEALYYTLTSAITEGLDTTELKTVAGFCDKTSILGKVKYCET
jgi:hypothetical protein